MTGSCLQERTTATTVGSDLQAPVLLLGPSAAPAPPSWSSRPAVFPFSGLVSLPGACLCCRCLLFLLENEDSFFKNVQTTWKEKALSLQVLGSRSSRPLPQAVGDVAQHGSPGALSLSWSGGSRQGSRHQPPPHHRRQGGPGTSRCRGSQ